MFLCLTSTAYALDDYTPITPLPGLQNNAGKTNLETYIPGLFRLSIGIAAVMAFVMITVGGIVYATSDSLTNKSEGRRLIENALWGLLLVIGAYAILNTINPNILKFSFNPQDASTPASTVTTSPNTPPAGLQPSTTKAILSLRSQCTNCSITITSTTGDSHTPGSLHFQGLAVDIRSEAALTNFLTGSTNSPAPCTVVNKTLNGVSSRFLWEPKGATCGGTVPSSADHWHMSVQ